MIAHHENLPEIAAAELGHYLLRTPDGETHIKSILREDLAAARASGDGMRECRLKLLLRDFVRYHPACEERHRERPA